MTFPDDLVSYVILPPNHLTSNLQTSAWRARRKRERARESQREPERVSLKKSFDESRKSK